MSSSSPQRASALTERDHELLVSLFKYRYLSTSQLQRLHFPSAQTTTRRIRQLAAAGYVSSFRTIASSDHLVALARLGAEAVAERLGVPLAETGWDARREHPKDYLFLQHFLAASDFRITLTKACAQRPDIGLLGFIPEYVVDGMPTGAVRKHIRDVTADVSDQGHKIAHTPDGVFALGRGGVSALFFLEVDRGTEVLTNPNRGVLKIVRFYLSSLVTGSYQRYRDDFQVTEPFKAFRALFVVSSAERLRNIRKLCGTLPFSPEHAKHFLWLTTSEAVLDPELLSREWCSLDPEDTKPYRILPA